MYLRTAPESSSKLETTSQQSSGFDTRRRDNELDGNISQNVANPDLHLHSGGGGSKKNSIPVFRIA
jgi:hypothetical protein